MKINKLTSLLAFSLFLIPIQKGDLKLNIASPTPTVIASPSVKFIKPGVIKEIGNLIGKTYGRGEMRNVAVTAVGAQNITVLDGTTSIKVDLASNIHYRRRFWGKSSLNEIHIGDRLDIVGRWINEEKTEVSAVLIRNLSIRKRVGVFFGTVKNSIDTGFSITTIHNGNESVLIDSSTKLIDRNGEIITEKEILEGHKIRVRGLWDSVNSAITEVTEIKDFSLPIQATPESK